MRLFDDKKYEYLEHALKAAYHDRGIPELSIRWRQQVMRTIRQIGSPHGMFKPITFAQQFVWRFVMVACVVMVMLLGYLWYAGRTPFYDVNELFLDESVQLTVVQLDEEF